jgi:hypothetical protein
MLTPLQWGGLLLSSPNSYVSPYMLNAVVEALLDQDLSDKVPFGCIPHCTHGVSVWLLGSRYLQEQCCQQARWRC